MSLLTDIAIDKIRASDSFFYKYLTPNDVGASGSHQSGIYIRKEDGKKLFEKKHKKGENVHIDITISWLDTGLNEDCRFIYYGKAMSKNEYRITRISRKFRTNDFLVLVKDGNDFLGFVLDESESKVLLLAL